MKVVLANIENIIHSNNKSQILNFAQKDIKNEKKLLQHSLGRFLLDFCLDKFYGIKEYNISIDKTGKPCLDKDINFSISHSKNYVMIALSKTPIGVDIEQIRDRDFKSILNHYNIEKDANSTEFYQLWTDYEARIKSGLKDKSISYKLDNYILSVSSNSTQLEIYEAIIPTDNINPNVLISLKPANIKRKNENTVDVQADNTAILEFLPPLDLKIE